MGAKLFIPPNKLIPTSEFALRSDERGKWSATHVLQCRYVDYANPEIASKLVRNETRLTDLDPNIPIEYNFIKLADYTHEHQKGGITRIRCTFSGVDPNEDQSASGRERSTTYEYRGDGEKASILEHPNFLKDVSILQDRQALAALYDGTAYTPDGVAILDKVGDIQLANITDPKVVNWMGKILAGRKTWDRPLLEWSISQTNEGGLTDEDLAGFGQKEDEPDGDPPKPEWASEGWWRFDGFTESKTGRESSYERSYTLRYEKHDPDIHAFKVEQP